MIEILVVRDPDMADEIRVWVDGVESNDHTEVYVDAGAGWEFSDWLDAREDALARVGSHACYDAVLAAYRDPPGKNYINHWPEEDQPC